MSHDVCRKCGWTEPEPYKEVGRMCERPDCPQRKKREFIDNLLYPVYKAMLAAAKDSHE